MKHRSLTLAVMAFAIASALSAQATETWQQPSVTVPVTNTSSSGADAQAAATGGSATNTLNAPITVSPTTTLTANPVSGADASATINGGNTTVSPTITGGNSSATGGNATLQNAGNATLTGNVSGTNTLNGTVSGTNTNNVRNDLTNQVGVTSNNANLNSVNATTGNNTNTLNGGSVVDNSKTTNTLVGGTTSATGTANVHVGDQTTNTNVNASGGQGGAGGASSSTSSVNNSGNSHSVSGVTNSGNSQSGSSSSSSSQGGSVSHTGNVSNAGNSSVVINNPKPLPPAPGIVNANSTAPTLFEHRGLPANAKGLDLALRFMRACPSTYVKGVKLSEVREKGDSGRTNLIFTPHSNYAKYGNSGDVQISQVVEIPDNAKVGEHRYLCLGLIQSEAIAKESSEVPIQTVINDAVRFTGDELRGFTKINLVLIPKEALSVNMGVDAGGKGFGIAPGASGMINSLLATLGAGYSSNTGQTFPVAQLGGTFIVVAEGDFPSEAAHIDFAPAVIQVSEEQKQLDQMRGELAKAQAETIAAKQAASVASIARGEAETALYAAEVEARSAKQIVQEKPAAPVAKKPVHKKAKLARKSPPVDPCARCLLK